MLLLQCIEKYGTVSRRRGGGVRHPHMKRSGIRIVSLNLTNDVYDGTPLSSLSKYLLGSDWSPLVAQELKSSNKYH